MHVMNIENRHIIIMFLDLIIGIHLSYKLLRVLTLFSVMCTIVSIYHLYTLGNLNRQIRLILLKINQNRRLTGLIIFKIKYLLKLHSQLCLNHIQTSKEFWSSFLAGYFLLSIPFNVLLVIGLVMNVVIFYTIYIITCLILHLILTLFPSILFAQQSKKLHEIGESLVPIIKAFSGRTNFQLKLKLNDLFGRLNFGPKYGTYVLVLGTLTYSVISNVC